MIMVRINYIRDIKASSCMTLLISFFFFVNQNCLFHQIFYRKDVQDTHMYNAELDRPDIKMATQISKIISDVISLSYFEQNWFLILVEDKAWLW